MEALGLTVSYEGQQAQAQAVPFGVGELSIESDPSSVEVGVSCGMSDMCGESPCLCGAENDAWGDCACNGLETLAPAITVSSSNTAVAWPVQVGGTWHVVTLLPGEAQVQVSASLKHYDDAVQTLQLKADAPGGLLIAAVIVVAAVVVAAATGVGKLRTRKASSTDGRPGEEGGCE